MKQTTHSEEHTHNNNTHNKRRRKITRLCNNHGGNIEIRVPFYLDIINAFFFLFTCLLQTAMQKEREKKNRKKTNRSIQNNDI